MFFGIASLVATVLTSTTITTRRWEEDDLGSPTIMGVGADKIAMGAGVALAVLSPIVGLPAFITAIGLGAAVGGALAHQEIKHGKAAWTVFREKAGLPALPGPTDTAGGKTSIEGAGSWAADLLPQPA